MRTTIPKTLRPLVRRERALALLRDWRQHRIIGIIAPAGYGKTTFASEWLRELATTSSDAAAGADIPSIFWCSLDAAADAPDVLLPRVLGLLDDAASLAAVLRAGEMPAEQVLALALADLGRRPDAHILIFDDFHLLQNPDVHRLVQAVVDSAPPNLLIVFLSRTTLPLQLIRQRLSGELLEIGQPELTFDHAEFLDFARASGLATNAPNDLDDIEGRSAGWAAALQMFALAGARGTPTIADSLYLPDFLQHEVLRHQPPDMVDALVRTAVLPHLDIAGLRAVLDTDAAHASALLQRLMQADLLTQTLAPTRGRTVAVRLHPLLREFLLQRLHLQFSPDEIAAIRTRAADALAAAGDVDAALALHEDDFAAARLLAAHTRATLLRFDIVALRRWLKRLSPAAIRSQPQVALDAAWLAAFTDSPDIATRQKDASAAVRSYPADAPASPDARAEWQAEMLVLEFLVAVEETHVSESRSLYALAAAAPRAADGLAASYLLSMTAHAPGLDLPLAERLSALEQSVGISRRLGFTHSALESLVSRALLYWQNLDLARTLITCDEVIAVAELDHWQFSHVTALALYFRAEALYYLDRIDEARDAYRRANDLAIRIHPAAAIDYWVHIGLTMCDIAVDAPNAAPDDAEDERLFALDGRRLHSAYFSRSIWLRIQRDMRLGRLDRIAASAEHLHMSPTEVVPDTREVAGLAVFAHAIFTGSADEATLTALTTYGAYLNGVDRIWFGMHARILRCVLLMQLGHHQEAAISLRSILKDVEKSRGVRFLLDYPQLAPLLEKETSPLAQSLRTRLPSSDGSLTHPFGLSDREVQILRQIIAGRETKEIAVELAISVGTLRVHTYNLYRKMNVHSRAEAVRTWRKVTGEDSDSGL